MGVIGFLTSYTAEAYTDIVPFGDIELRNLELGYFVHIEHKMDNNYETSLVSPMLLRQCSKVKTVDLHRDYKSSAKKTIKSAKEMSKEIDVVYCFLFPISVSKH